METKIKICGLTKPSEAEYLNEAGVDYAGMVLFFERSRRCISLEQAKLILDKLDPGIRGVAVTVAPSLEQVTQIREAGFSLIQIHGELPEGIGAVDIEVLKAFNVSDMDAHDKVKGLPQVIGYVFDAARPGSGETFDWKLMDQIPRDEKLLFLAGGLNADNVAQAITYLHPDGVDVSSGVEDQDPFGKNKKKISAFVKAARSAQDGQLFPER